MNGAWDISSLDYFAARAPVEIPEWFQHTPPAIDYPPMPDPNKIEDNRLCRIACDWMRDGCFELPDELEQFGTDLLAFRNRRDAWKEKNAAARYFQWRWYYAQMMLATRRP